MSNNTCIRVLADANQIKECKTSIEKIEKNAKSLSSILGLAGNEVRLKILFLLHKEGEMCPCDLSDVLEMKVPAISQHLRKLKDGGMISNKKVGQTIFYSLVKEQISIIKPVLKLLVESEKQKVTVS